MFYFWLMCLTYELCPSHYLSAPVLTWDVLPNLTKVELEIFSIEDMHLFFQKCIRGGFCYTSKRYSKANNKYLKPYDPKQESRHIICFDANNLFGYVMSKYLPTDGFKWVDPGKFEQI